MNFETLKRIHDAMEIIRSGKIDEMDIGRHDLSDIMYVNISKYQTQNNGIFEAHRNYIDIHYIMEGCEIIEIADQQKLQITKAYDEVNDSVLGTATGNKYLLSKGQIMVLFPEEAHLPGLKVGKTSLVKKAVIKVHI